MITYIDPSPAHKALYVRSQHPLQAKYDVSSSLNGRCTSAVALVQRPFGVDPEQQTPL